MSRINNTEQLTGLRKFAEDKSFQAKWAAVKQGRKVKLAALIKTITGEDVPVNAMFDIQVQS